MRALLLVVLICSACRENAPTPPPPQKVEVAPRRGTEPRAELLEKAPSHGLLLSSVGLVNETFILSVDFDSKLLEYAVRHAVDGSQTTTHRTLSEAELAELIKLRERTWTEGTELPRKPAAEYQEHLYLLDAKDTAHVRADDGFSGDDPAGALARRMKELAAASQ